MFSRIVLTYFIDLFVFVLLKYTYFFFVLFKHTYNHAFEFFLKNSSLSFICTINVGLEICRGDALSWFFICFLFLCYGLHIWSTLLVEVFLFLFQFLPFNCPSPSFLLFVRAASLLSVEACIMFSKGLRGSTIEMHSFLHGLMWMLCSSVCWIKQEESGRLLLQEAMSDEHPEQNVQEF